LKTVVWFFSFSVSKGCWIITNSFFDINWYVAGSETLICSWIWNLDMLLDLKPR
jgi:hypothetical protein